LIYFKDHMLYKVLTKSVMKNANDIFRRIRYGNSRAMFKRLSKTHEDILSTHVGCYDDGTLNSDRYRKCSWKDAWPGHSMRRIRRSGMIMMCLSSRTNVSIELEKFVEIFWVVKSHGKQFQKDLIIDIFETFCKNRMLLPSKWIMNLFVMNGLWAA